MLIGQRALQLAELFPLVDVNRGIIRNGSFGETGHNLLVLLKNKWVDFLHYRLVVFTHCGHTTVFKHLIKVIFA